MARVKTGTTRRHRHQALIARNRGYKGTRSKLFRRANETFLKAQWYAYRDRRNRKRDLRRLWITRINAAARLNGTTYSRFIAAMRTSGVVLNRKMLADLAVRDANVFTKVVQAAQAK
jgi:large subunit ribosomal protein L20